MGSNKIKFKAINKEPTYSLEFNNSFLLPHIKDDYKYIKNTGNIMTMTRTEQVHEIRNKINGNIGWVSYDIDDFFPKEFFIINRELDESVFTEKVYSTVKELREASKLLNESGFIEKYNVRQYWGLDSDDEFGFVYEKNSEFLIKFISTYKQLVILIHSPNFELTRDIKNQISEIYPTPKKSSTIKWYYKDGMSINDIVVNVNDHNLPCDEFYPFLKEKNVTLTEYYDNYLKSEESVLVLIGPPGTGKTSFIKGLLNYSGYNAMTSSEAEVLYTDSMFIKYITSDIDIFLVEDADQLLRPREVDNPVMHKLLNASDGLISMNKKKKMIFSTNLENIDEIDPALIRPGRCYEILQFGELTENEAKVIIDKFNISSLPEDKVYVLANILNMKKKRVFEDYKINKKSGKIGFI